MILNKENQFSFFKGFFKIFYTGPSRTELIRRAITSRKESEALYEDWINIGGDFKKAFDKIKQEEKFHVNAAQ
jgi:hypothetical protein